MHAYKKSIRTICQTCSAVADQEVFNTHNATMGFFCDYCADRKIAELKELPDPKLTYTPMDERLSGETA